MSDLKVFISSSLGENKHLRSTLKLAIESLGYQPILFEYNSIGYGKDNTLENCKDSIRSSSIFLLLLTKEGAGSFVASNGGGSVYTKEELLTAIEERKKIYVLIERAVYHDYNFYKRNLDREILIDSLGSKDIPSLNLATKDHLVIFEILETVNEHNFTKFVFDDHHMLGDWLKEQWSRVFHQFLLERNHSEKIKNLSDEVVELRGLVKILKDHLEVQKETFETFGNYLEHMIQLSPGSSNKNPAQFIEEETKNLEIRKVELVRYLRESFRLEISIIESFVKNSNTLPQFKKSILSSIKSNDLKNEAEKDFSQDPDSLKRDFDRLKNIINK